MSCLAVNAQAGPARIRYAGKHAACLVLAALLALGGCAAKGPTPYGPKFGAFGYSDDRRDDGTIEVSFTGNSETSRTTVEGFALYRAAQVTRAAGFTHFAIMKRKFRHRLDSLYDRQPAPGIIMRESSHQYGGLPDGERHDSSTEIRRDWMTSTLVIRPYSGAPPAGALHLEDADAVMRRLAPLFKKTG